MKGDKVAKHVLAVDDEAPARNLIELLLTEAGCVVECASSGQEALALLEARRFDLVLTDNVMPGMAGVELARAVRSRWPTLPIVMLSGYPPQTPEPSLSLILKKPEGISKLIESVRKLLGDR
jgi:two-component system, cell cycle sensor histidine kinase and response regulator CckA